MYCVGTPQTMVFNILNFTAADAGIYFGGFSANTITFSGNCNPCSIHLCEWHVTQVDSMWGLEEALS